jgi:hypothetical protein
VRVVIESHWRGERWEGDIPDAKSATPLEHVFRYFNRVDDDDHERLLAIGYRLPSLSVGDVVVVDGKRWRCASVGWEPADEPSGDPIVLLQDHFKPRSQDT